MTIFEPGGGHKQCRPGWVQAHCPFCSSAKSSSSGPKLGYNLHEGYFNCYSCGGKSIVSVVQIYTGAENREAWRLAQAYGVDPGSLGSEPGPKKIVVRRKACKLPKRSEKLGKAHAKYLCSRGFDPQTLSRVWGIKGTGALGGRYRWRIIIPVLVRGRLVTYQTRSISKTSDRPYLAADPDREVTPIKETLYGYDLALDRDTVVVVEGVTDAWRWGPGAVCTWGIEWSAAQVALLLGWKNRVIIYDSEPLAQEKAMRLARACDAISGTTQVVDLETGGDLGDLSPKKVKKVKKCLSL